MVNLVPRTGGAEKPRVFLWEAAAAAVRVVGSSDAPWFVAKDVCAALDIERTDSALRGLDEDEKGAHTVSTLGGPQEVSTVNESGLYALIFRSRKDQARVFRKWVTSEVLPAIRKTGAYVAPVAPPPALPAPRIIEIHHRQLPPEKIPDEQEVVCCLLGVALGILRDNVIVHSTTLFDLAVREDVLGDWVGTHPVEWQRRGRFMHRLRAFTGRWLQSKVVSRWFYIAVHGKGRTRRYQIAVRHEPRSDFSCEQAPSPKALEIVSQALSQGGEVVVK